MEASESLSFKARMKQLEERGVNINLLLSDWCVTCLNSGRIIPDVNNSNSNTLGICETGCNGIPPFYLNKKGRRVFSGKPLMFEPEPDIDVDI